MWKRRQVLKHWIFYYVSRMWNRRNGGGTFDGSTGIICYYSTKTAHGLAPSQTWPLLGCLAPDSGAHAHARRWLLHSNPSARKTERAPGWLLWTQSRCFQSAWYKATLLSYVLDLKYEAIFNIHNLVIMSSYAAHHQRMPVTLIVGAL